MVWRNRSGSGAEQREQGLVVGPEQQGPAVALCSGIAGHHRGNDVEGHTSSAAAMAAGDDVERHRSCHHQLRTEGRRKSKSAAAAATDGGRSKCLSY